MEDNEIRQLLEKYRKGQATDKEIAILETWYMQWHNEPFPISAEELEETKAGVWDSLNLKQSSRFSRVRWFAAASILLISTIGFYFLHKQQIETKPADHLVANQVAKDFKPGGNKALLTLAGGKKVVLNNLQNGKISVQGSAMVSKTSEGNLTYTGNETAASYGNLMNTLSTPRGGQYHLTLADGTQVWLNAASSITFPVRFDKGERVVNVTGEVYFEVAHKSNNQIFKVVAGKQEITVLGTRFNVRNYDDDKTASTTLLSGSVHIKNTITGKTAMLTPGQEARIIKADDQLTVRQVNAENAICWKNGYFLFDNQGIESIMRIMSRWYDVDFSYQGKLSKDRFGGTFSRSANLSETLKNLELLGKVHFKIMADKVIVTE
ncbi:DUF4974 domain-containing protein [Mucilaginibacter sp. SMC90]|uniref:FecR family protein n=1 Tax=Mucilaginibacter sp. SMC90 TaxID=2929803 RepID=UPI001FB26661|nr:FecR family protein [Mucilaginibacter sp. SMC90]UOE47231.1 DUF4974 domain-containing protein [Mucilaginibacter sp. SMC90]